MLLMMLRNTKSPKETIVGMAMLYILHLQPILFHLPIGKFYENFIELKRLEIVHLMTSECKLISSVY